MTFLEGIVPRDYQKEIAKTCVDKNCLVVLPTGLGKTLIALLVLIERMKKYPLKKVLVLAPTKPLIEQHYKSFKKSLPELFAQIDLFTGEVKKEERKKRWQNSDIILSTPQCIANDLKKNLYDLSEVSLLIEDEAHRCVKNYDYTFIAKKYVSSGSDIRILGLTASPGSDKKKISEICSNLFIEEIEIRNRESDDVEGYLQKLETKKILVEFPKEMVELRAILKNLFDKYISEMKERNVLYGPVSKTNLILLQKKMMSSISRGNKNFNYMLGISACAQAIKIQHALELLETQTLQSFFNYLKKLFYEASKKQSKGVVRLVSNQEFNYCYMLTNELLIKGYEHPKLSKLQELICFEKEQKKDLKVIVFSQFRDTALNISTKLNLISGVNAQVFLGQSKKKSVFDESVSGLNQKEQKRVLEEFREGKINVLCATSIGEEGLDIPEVDLVVFYEPIPSAIRKIQRGGRTARLSEGKIITLITKGTRDETFHFISNAREKKMGKLIKEIKEEFNKKEIQKKL